MFLETFTDIYKLNFSVDVTIDGQVYKIARKYFPDGKEIILGIIGETVYSKSYIYRIMYKIKTCLAKQEEPTSEVKKLNPDCGAELKIFKYTSDVPGYDFVIIRHPQDQALNKKEVDWLWEMF